MLKLSYLKTMDFDFENILVINCDTVDQLCKLIENNQVLTVMIGQLSSNSLVYYINSSYVMYFKQ